MKTHTRLISDRKQLILLLAALALVLGIAFSAKSTAVSSPALPPGGKGGMLLGSGPNLASQGDAASGTEAAKSSGSAQGAPSAPVVVYASYHDTSPPLRTMDPAPAGVANKEHREPENPPKPWQSLPEFTGLDPVVQSWMAPLAMPTPILTFNGFSQPDNRALYAGLGYLPPDTNGDIGPNHYVEQVNNGFKIFDRQGNLLYGPAKNSAIWAGMPVCGVQNWGDPITLYDQLADRWLVSQFAFLSPANPPYYECIAISATPDPLGAWHRYEFQVSNNGLNDYPHFGMWPDAYYMTTNEFAPVTLAFVGAGNYAFDRTRMLQGLPASYVYFHLPSPHGGFLPTDMDGPTPPPAGSPNYFIELWDNIRGQAALYKFRVNWLNPTASTFTGPTYISIAPFDYDLCAATRERCIDQPNTTQKLEAISDRLMYRLAYRNFGTHESLVVNHTVDAYGAGLGGVRWYEIRNPNGTPGIHQQGTFAPDNTHRWMGSIAMDRDGNMALGYTASSSTLFPSMRYTGRLASDPPGVMAQGEGTFRAGAGSQTHSEGRWGDYSFMSVDPLDDCTFWYVSEVMPSTSSAEWRTVIGAFKFPSCGGEPTPTPTGTPPTSTPTPTSTFTNTPVPTSTPDPCAVTVTGSLDLLDPLQLGRLFRDGSPSLCANPKQCPGLYNNVPVAYETYTFTNITGSSTCITVNLQANGTCAVSGNVFSAAYLGSYDPTNLCLNYLADGGGSPNPVGSYSFTVPAGANFVVVVHEVNPAVGCESFTLTVSGAGCQQPATATPTPETPVPTNTPTETATSTPEPPPTETPLPCSVCNLHVSNVSITCDASGLVQWSATVKNRSTCAVSSPWTAELQVRTNNDRFTTEATQSGATTFPPGDTVVSGAICHQFAPGATGMRLLFSPDTTGERCKLEKKSQVTAPCNRASGCPR